MRGSCEREGIHLEGMWAIKAVEVEGKNEGIAAMGKMFGGDPLASGGAWTRQQLEA